MKLFPKKTERLSQSALIATIFALFIAYVVLDSLGIQLPVWLLVIIAMLVGILIRWQSGD